MDTSPNPPRASWYMTSLILFLFVVLHFSQAQISSDSPIVVDGVYGTSNTTCCPEIGGHNISCKNLTLAFECALMVPPSMQVSVIVNEGTYVLTHDPTLTVFRQRNGGFSLTGHCPVRGCVEITCEENAGLFFILSDNIQLQNLTLTGCGFPNNSTTRDVNLSSFEIIKSALYFLLCRNVTLVHITVQQSDGCGMVMYSTMGINTITQSNFLSNKHNPNGGGGLCIEFAFCYPGNTSCFNGTSNIPDSYTSGSTYVISESVFAENIANVSSHFTLKLPQKSNHIAFGRGGGLSVFFKGSASNNTIVIECSNFTNNSALWGGGFFVEHQDNSYNNTLIVNNTIVSGNECFHKNSSSQGTGGGGARAVFVFYGGTHAKKNSVQFDNCIFSDNSAFFGGGVSLYAVREPTESSPTNLLVFTNTTWQSNVAWTGSAVDLSVWRLVTVGASATANFTDCTFRDNNGYYTNEPNMAVGVGAVYLDSISIFLMGKNRFEMNTHSALAAVSTGIYLTTNSSLYFVNNTGRRGGAIALLGYAFLETSPSSEVVFINNTADINGGAIYQYSIGEHDLFNSRNCFIRYSDFELTPENWTSTFFFCGNRANDRNESIYTTSLFVCQLGGVYGNNSVALAKVFCWSDRWIYAGGNCTTEVRTAPSHFEPESSFAFDIIPGQRRVMPLKAVDDRGTDVTAYSVLRAKAISHGVYIDPSSEIIADNRIEVHTDNVTNLYEISLETSNPRVVQTTLNISVNSCPPGMVLRGGEKTASCECGGHFNGRLECNRTGFSTKLRRGNWIGKYTYKSKQKVVASDTLYFCSHSNDLFFTLPNNTEELDDFLCRKINRTGTLCGKCRDGYGPNLHTLGCIKCDSIYIMWLYYILVQYVPLTVFFIVVIVMDIRATSAPANAFIFFAQVVPSSFLLYTVETIDLNEGNDILYDLYTLAYDIWSLRFFSIVQENICLSPHLDSLQIITITSLEALYPLVLIVLVSGCVWLYEKGYRGIVCVCRPLHSLLARFQQKFNIRRSLIHAFASFILLSYSRFIIVSYLLLNRTILTTDDGGTFGPELGVLILDGTIPYMSIRHAPYVALSLLILLTFVGVPLLLLLLLPLIRNLSIIRNRWPKYFRMLPTFEQCVCTKCSCCWPKLTVFLEAFHGCYKNGTTSTTHNRGTPEFDYRWCAGFYLLLRVVIYLNYAFAPDFFTSYSFLQFLWIGCILFFLLLRPYRNDFYNKLDALMFSLIVSINTLTMYNLYSTAVKHKPSLFAFVIQSILIFLPLIYISFIVMAYMYRCCKRQRHPIDEDGGEFVGNEDELQEGSNNFLPFVEQTGRIHDINVYRPAIARRSEDSERQLLVSKGITSSNRTLSSVQPYQNEPRHMADKP